MSETCVELVQTPITMEAFARALALAWRGELGALPTKEQAGVLWAHYGIETGAGPKAAAWNWNIGNVKHVPGDGHDFIMLPNTWEMVGGKRVVFQPPHPATWFRAFSSLDAAMVEHFRFLRSRKYGSAWEGVELGDCGLFARRLKAAGYYTADATAYTNGMLAHFRAWMRSDAFERALEGIAAEPSVIEPGQLLEDAAIVHPRVPLPEREPRES